MILENPLLALLIGVGFCIACLAMWVMSRHWLPLAAAGASFLITAVLVALSLFVQTPKEQVEWTTQQLAMAVQRNDAATLLEFISPSAIDVRNAAEREMEGTKFIHCWIAKIHRISIDESTTPSTARVNLAVIADVEQSVHGSGRGRVQLWLDMNKESDGRWRVTGYSYTIE